MDKENINIINQNNLSTTTTSVPDFFAYIFLLIASIFWGGNYLPVKYYETGDGMFFQLIVCIAIWFCGVLINFYQNFPTFYAFPVLGGFLWTTGSMLSVPIIKFIGIGLGSLFWNLIALISGWCTFRFGLFGIGKDIVKNETFNIIGAILSMISVLLFLFVKFNPSVQMVLIGGASNVHPQFGYVILDENFFYKSRLEKFYDNLGQFKKQVIGTLMSIFTGVMFGVSYTPIIYIQNNYENASKDYNDYSFSYACGILLASYMYFIIYCIYERNNPQIYPKTILPGLVTGLLWGIANFCYFLATNNLSQTITFPLVNSGPIVVAFIISLIYKEIKGYKNYILIFVGILVAIIGSIFSGLSK